jgi:hypothetical protein
MLAKIMYLSTSIAFIIVLLLFHDKMGMTHSAVLWAILITLGFRIITSIIVHQQMTEINELKMYIKVCAWCKCVGIEDKWLTFEEWSEMHSNKKTKHSVCPKCQKQIDDDLAAQYS